MARTSPEVYTGSVGNNLLFTNITNAWTGVQKVFRQLLRSTRQEKNSDATMSNANGKNDTDGAPPAGSTRESGKDNDTMMSNTEEHKSKEETYEREN